MPYASVGNFTNCTTGRLISPLVVLRITTLTTPSAPGCIFSTRPIFQTVGGTCGVLITTTSPTATLGSHGFHLDLCCNVDKYSRDHWFQKCWWHCRNICQRFNWFCDICDTSCSGIATNGWPINKCPGVSQFSSPGSEDNGVSGR